MKIQTMVFALVILAGPAVSPAAAAEESGEAPLRAAILVQNRAGEDFDGQIDVLNDLISARLTERGFSILDKQYVMDRFRAAREQDPLREEKKIIEALTEGRIDFKLEEAMKDASALRVAEMVGVDYIIVATLTSLGRTEKTFTGRGTIHGVDNQVTEYTLRVGLRVLEAARGGSVYGDVVLAVERIPRTRYLEIASSDILNSLLDTASEKIAGNIVGRVDRIRAAREELPALVPFTVAVLGTDFGIIELDGAVIGAAGGEPVELYASPGIHMLRVSRDWFRDWEKPVNIREGQHLSVALEFSRDGLDKFKDLEGFRKLMAEDAESHAIRQIADGERKRREESYARIDTSKVERLSVGGDTSISDIDVTIEEKVK